MTAIGSAVTNALAFLGDFFKDVYKLVATVEGGLSGTMMVPAWGSTSMWGRSSAHSAPGAWLPKYVARVYVPQRSGDDAKPDTHANLFAFFIVYFSPKKFDEPIAVWGVGTQEKRGDLSAFLSGYLINEDGPTFLEKEPSVTWKSPASLPAVLSTLKYRSCLLLELPDARAVELSIVSPLKEEIASLRAGRFDTEAGLAH
jgi:hypothetical protein